jgi:hypothetical protein
MEMGSYTIFEPQFRVLFTDLSLSCIKNAVILHSKSEVISKSVVKYCSSVLFILKSCMHVIGQKACGRSHLHLRMFLTLQC